jgi:hypothetical protein
MRVCQFRHSGTIEPSANGWIRQQLLVYKSRPRCQTQPASNREPFTLPAHRHLYGNGFQLRQMIQVVTRHGFDEGPEGHLPTLRMQHRLGHQLRRYRAQEHQIPLADAGKRHHGRLWIITGIVGRPKLLIERLDDVMVLRQRLAKAESENDLAICQVAQNFVRAPFSRSG